MKGIESKKVLENEGRPGWKRRTERKVDSSFGWRIAKVDELAKLMKLSRNYVYRLAKRGDIPGVVRVGSRLLFDLDKVEPWMAAGGVKGKKEE